MAEGVPQNLEVIPGILEDSEAEWTDGTVRTMCEWRDARRPRRAEDWYETSGAPFNFTLSLLHNTGKILVPSSASTSKADQ